MPESAAFVLVHDAARPLVTSGVIDRVLAGLAAGADAVIPGVPMVDTVKRVAGGRVVETLDRDELVAVQTPQGFPRGVLAAGARLRLRGRDRLRLPGRAHRARS